MIRTARHTLAFFAFALVSLLAMPGHAGVIVHGTRVVYPAQQSEVVVRLENKGARPALVQVWLDDGDIRATPATAQAPFTATPPIFRIEPGKQQAVRLHYTGEPLPTDRESLFWLNVYEVPPKAEDAANKNKIELAFRTRLRVFFRPQGLPHPATVAASKLTWKLVPHDGGYAMEATNPTPYHVSLPAVELVNGGRRYKKAPNKLADDSLMLPAGDVKRFPLPELKAKPTGAMKVEFTAMSDFGARVPHTANLAP